MPIIKSAIKRAKQNRKKRDEGKPIKSLMKTRIKDMEDAHKAGKAKEVKEMLPLAYKAIDMAAKHRIIHENTAARKKKRMARLASLAS